MDEVFMAAIAGISSLLRKIEKAHHRKTDRWDAMELARGVDSETVATRRASALEA
jgi:hypothetical protein